MMTNPNSQPTQQQLCEEDLKQLSNRGRVDCELEELLLRMKAIAGYNRVPFDAKFHLGTTAEGRLYVSLVCDTGDERVWTPLFSAYGFTLLDAIRSADRMLTAECLARKWTDPTRSKLMGLRHVEMDPRPALGGWAPGPYHNECPFCKKLFLGDRRATRCAPCAYDVAALDKERSPGYK